MSSLIAKPQVTDNNKALTATNICFSYKGGGELLSNINFSLIRGEVCGLLGPNGAGKTTLISIFTTLFAPDSGTLLIMGQNPENKLEEIRKNIGVVPQDLALYDNLTAKENIRYFGLLYGLEKKMLEERMEELLEQFGLHEHGNKLVKTYSGGMKRRLNIILGMVHRPSLLFLDEPTVGIDTQSRNLIVERLLSLSGKDLTLLYTTHHIEEVDKLCSRVAILDHGRFLADDTPANLLKDHGHSSLEELFLHLTGKHLRDG